jgi:UDP-glucose 4-epimerase
MSKLLITGAAGYIGSHTAKFLLRQGHELVGLDTFERGSHKLSEIEYVICDVADVEQIKALCRKHKFDGVMHFAAYASVEESVRKPMLYYQNNTIGTLQMISALLECGVSKIVFSSSCSVYGMASEKPIEETDPTAPINPYGASKLMVEEFLRHSAHEKILQFVSLRYFNAAGTDPEGELGEDHEPELHLIPNVFRAALRNKPFQMFGDDYPTNDGTCVRDYIHVCDLADAHSKAWNFLAQNKGSAVYNLGTEKGYSIRQILDEASKVVGHPISFNTLPRRPGDPPTLIASSRKIEAELGWKPKFGLKEILETAYKWELKRV